MVLCTTIIPSYMHTHMSSSYRWTRACWFRLGFFLCVFFVFLTIASLFVIFVFLCIIWFLFGCQYQRNWLLGKTRLWSDLLCVEWDVKFYSLTQLCSGWRFSRSCPVSVYKGCVVAHDSFATSMDWLLERLLGIDMNGLTTFTCLLLLNSWTSWFQHLKCWQLKQHP